MSQGPATRPAPVQGVFVGMPTPLYAASPSRLLAWLDCPRRYRFAYLDRPRPPARPQRAHTSVGVAVHNALRDWWDQPQRSAEAAAALVGRSWIDLGFRDSEQSRRWRERSQAEVAAYVRGLDATVPPLGLERTAAFKTSVLAFFGRIDRLDDRAGQLVVVDYKTGRHRLTDEDARTSLPLALYAAAVWKMFRRPCLRVELHHVPTGTIAAFEHTSESLTRKVREAESIAADLRRADARYAAQVPDAASFTPRVSPLCQWCDYRAHCREGQQAGPEKVSWAALEENTDDRVTDETQSGGRIDRDGGGWADGFEDGSEGDGHAEGDGDSGAGAHHPAQS
ncbi:MAG: PD-(D/E)XK nuclease family protein [Candidatus Phosphoribacter sp.]